MIANLGHKLCVIALTALAVACSEATAPERAAPGPPPAAEATAARTGPVIVMLGDSLTAGFGLPADAALPEQVAERLAASGRAVTMINAGVSGDTTANGLARYDWSVASAEPDLLVVALGANDFLQGASPDRAEANLAAILERAAGENVPVALLGLEPRSQEGALARDRSYTEIYTRLAERFDAPLYPALLAGVQDEPALLQADGLHPTAEGVELIADGVAAFLAPLIDDLEP